MNWRGSWDRKASRLTRSREIAAPVGVVFEGWSRLERLPKLLANVRRVKRIGDRRSLWDVDIAGRQVVGEAEETERVPGKSLGGASTGGAENRGRIVFTRLDRDRSRIELTLEFQPRSLLERLGVAFGLVGSAVDEDLARFARAIESRASEGSAETVR